MAQVYWLQVLPMARLYLRQQVLLIAQPYLLLQVLLMAQPPLWVLLLQVPRGRCYCRWFCCCRRCRIMVADPLQLAAARLP